MTIAHEIGHAFGLWHVKPSVRRSVMNPGNTTVTPTERDVDSVRALWGKLRPAAAGGMSEPRSLRRSPLARAMRDRVDQSQNSAPTRRGQTIVVEAGRLWISVSENEKRYAKRASSSIVG